MPVACFSTVSLLRSHLAAPTRYCVGVSCVRVGGGRAGLLWACLLVGGGVWCLRFLGVFVWVFAFLLVCARLGVVGRGLPRRPVSACLLVCLRFGVGAVGVCDAPLGAGVMVVGRDMIVPPHAVWRALYGCCVRVGREGCGVWGAHTWCANTRAHAEGEG